MALDVEAGKVRTLLPRGADELERAAQVIRGLNPSKPWRITIAQHHAKRSPEQNKLLWAIYTEIAKETGNDPEDIHEAMKGRFLPPVVVKLGSDEIAVNGSSAKLDTMEFSQFVERVTAFAASELGIVV